MADFVVGACAAVLVSLSVALAVAWAYWHGYDSGFEAGARAERSDTCERALGNSEGRRS